MSAFSKTNAIQKQREIAESTLPPVAAHLASLALKDGELQVLHSQVLCMSYVRPARTAGGIILTEKTQEEDRFQGSIGLVIAMGAGAFKDTAAVKFNGDTLKLHDWVLFRPADGLSMFVNGNACRLFQDADIMMKISNPELYW